MVQVGAVTIGEGQPKICASITESDRKAVIAAADILVQKSIDIIEWRLDFFNDMEDRDRMKDTLLRLKMSLGNKPLLITFRSEGEGGNGTLGREAYEELLLWIAESGYADMIDVEIFRELSYQEAAAGQAEQRMDEIREFIRQLQQKVIVVGSYHDFDGTPSREEMMGRLELMDALGADIPKLAVMPRNKKDALTLMTVTLEYSSNTSKPLITMAMGGLGVVSRLAGESFGSAVTFGCVGQPSAPGQVAVDRLEDALELIHQCYR